MKYSTHKRTADILRAILQKSLMRGIVLLCEKNNCLAKGKVEILSTGLSRYVQYTFRLRKNIRVFITGKIVLKQYAVYFLLHRSVKKILPPTKNPTKRPIMCFARLKKNNLPHF